MRIELALITNGAVGIMKNYKDGSLEAISFQAPTPGKRLTAVRLPANVDEVYQILKSAVKRAGPGTEERLRDQAARTAWKLIQDWVELQMTMIKMKQAEFLQVFLPYVWDGRQTYYAALKDGNFKLLKSHEEPEK